MNRLVEDLVNSMKDKGQWEESDQLLVDELNFNLDMMEKCKEEMKKTLVKNITRSANKAPYLHKNHFVNMYHEFLSNSLRLISLLNSNPRDRQKMKVELKKSQNAIEILQKEYEN